MPTCEELPHPMQPIGLDTHGVVRFKSNAIVQDLLDRSRLAGYDLNEIIQGGASPEDYTQLMQLIGYSVYGFRELSTSPSDLVTLADSEAERLMRDEALAAAPAVESPVLPSTSLWDHLGDE